MNMIHDIKLSGILICYLIVISSVAAIITISDKLRARGGKWRISENLLLTVAALGGSAAMLITMLIIRHKTKHEKFMFGIPLIIIFQLIIAAWCNYRFDLF